MESVSGSLLDTEVADPAEGFIYIIIHSGWSYLQSVKRRLYGVKGNRLGLKSLHSLKTKAHKVIVIFYMYLSGFKEQS